MRIINLGSGSKGNSTFIQAGEYRLLIDIGFSVIELTRRLETIGESPENIDAVLITHEHVDHIKGFVNFLKKYDSLFKGKKHIIMKTDNRKLFEYSIKSFTDYGYKINEISLDLYNDDISDNVATEYETRFHSLGQVIYKIDVEK